jgi:hypothetical protein
MALYALLLFKAAPITRLLGLEFLLVIFFAFMAKRFRLFITCFTLKNQFSDCAKIASYENRNPACLKIRHFGHRFCFIEKMRSTQFNNIWNTDSRVTVGEAG